MKKHFFTPTLGMLLLFLMSFQTQEKATSADKEKICGPSFVITNPGGFSVSKIRVHVSGATSYWLEFNNPTFPYSFSDPGIGTYTFLFHFSGSASGSINVTDWNNNFITCETFQTPYKSPVVFSAGCFVYYYLELGNSGC